MNADTGTRCSDHECDGPGAFVACGDSAAHATNGERPCTSPSPHGHDTGRDAKWRLPVMLHAVRGGADMGPSSGGLTCRGDGRDPRRAGGRTGSRGTAVGLEGGLVTGAGRGVGRAVALRLADAGADVVLVAGSQGQLNGTSSEITARGRSGMS